MYDLALFLMSIGMGVLGIVVIATLIDASSGVGWDRRVR
jgi:hypothetical protein